MSKKKEKKVSVIGTILNGLGRLSDSDSNDGSTFADMIKQIDRLIDMMPSILLSSSMIGKGRRLAMIKHIIANFGDGVDIGRTGMLTCSILNLFAQHSNNKVLSRISGFVQNCLAVYSIGDSFDKHINLRWNQTDSIYVHAVQTIPSSRLFSMDYVRGIDSFSDGDCSRRNTSIPISSIFALIRFMHDEKPIEWFSTVDQKTHIITPVVTNIERIERFVNPRIDNDDDSSSSRMITLRAYVKESFMKTIDHDDAYAVVVFKVDADVVYVTIEMNSMGKRDKDADANAFMISSNNVDYLWVAKKKNDETEHLYENMSEVWHSLSNMLFAKYLDTQRCMFTFDSDEYDLVELERPRAVPVEYVSDRIPHIIGAIDVMFKKSLSRGFALVGHPGTGKTIGAQQISNHFNDVCTFKVDFNVIDDPDCVDIFMTYVKAVKRCVIIIDDMDNANLTDKNSNVVKYLSFFDKLNMAAKNDHVSYVFIATINDPSKVNSTIMRRSGRIDEMIEVGYPNKDVIKYLFEYNDQIVNPDNRTDFKSDEFDAVMTEAADANVTAADITNIFSDIVIYNGHAERYTPEMVHDAITRVKTRNRMSTNNYLAIQRNDMMEVSEHFDR